MPKAKATSTTTEKESLQNTDFTVVFHYLGGKESHKVSSVEEGLAKIDTLKSMKGKCLVALEKDGKRSEIFLYPVHTKRLRVNKIFRQIKEKTLLTLLK